MPRPLRIEAAGMWYHIMNRGVLRKEIFACDEDYLRFLENLTEGYGKFNVEIHSYVFMPNHFHFFLKTNEANIGRFMHWQLTSYANWFNPKYERVGHLFQGRYKSIVIDNNNYGTEITRYIHLNPVRIKKNSKLSLSEKRKLLRNYKWSSYSAIIGIKPAPPFLFVHDTLECFGDDYNSQVKNYIDFVEEGIRKDLDSPLKNVAAQSVLGSKDFVEKIRKTFERSKNHDGKTDGVIKRLISLPIEKIFEIVCQEYNVNIDSILKSGRGRRDTEARRVTFYLASKYCVGIMTLNKIGKIMGCKNGSSVTLAVKRIKKLKGNDKILMKKLKCLKEKLDLC